MRRSTRVLTRGAALVASVAFCLGSAGAAYAERPADAGQQKTNQGSTQPGCDGSHHSDTGHGANTDGPDNPYHNTCDGSPSGNGNGKGEAKGRPAAGTVGNADDKNPPGQAPGPSDGNAGYECDRNHGIARSNPAHTGCTAPAPVVAPVVKPVVVTVTCPNGQTMTTDVNGDGHVNAADCTKPVVVVPEPDPVTCPSGETMTKDVNGDGHVNAADCATVKSGEIVKPLVPASVAGTRLVSNRPTVAGTTLPLTGSNGGTVVALAGVLLAAGAALVACGVTKEQGTPAC